MEEYVDDNSWEVSSAYHSDENDVIKSFITSNNNSDQDITSSSLPTAKDSINFNKYKDYSLLKSFKISNKSGSHIFPRRTEETATEAVNIITARLKDSYDSSFIYLSSSLMLDLDVPRPMRFPSSILLDVCVVSPFHPVGIFTFLSQNISTSYDESLAYNSYIVRCVTSSARQNGLTSFIPAHGVFDFATYADHNSFYKELQQLEKRACTIGMKSSLMLSKTVCDLMIQLFVEMLFKPSSASVAMKHACGEGNIQLVTDLISVSPEILNIPSEQGDTPLMWASLGGHYTVVQFLMSHQVDVNVKNNRAETSLILACRKSLLHKTLGKGKEESLPFLGRVLAHDLSDRLNNTCDGNEMDSNRQVVDLLLSHGADENVVDDDGFTPLILSCIFGDLELTKILLTRGVNVNFSGILDSTALIWACLFGHGIIVDSLIQAGADVNITTKFNVSPLFISSYFGREKVVERLISHGATVDETDESGHTALYYAVLYGFPSIVNLLISSGAKIDKPDNIGYTSLIAASWSGHSEIVEILLSHGADINHHSKDDTIPLVASAVVGHSDTVQLLLDHGAAINERGVSAMTALMWTSLAGCEDVAGLLLSSGADVNATDNNGETSLTLVLRNVQNVFGLLTGDKDSMVRLCFYAYKSDWSALEYAMHKLKNICTERMQSNILGYAHLTHDTELLSSLERVFSDHHLDTPTADGRRDRMLKMLLSQGADVNSRRKDGNSALLIASEEGHESSVRILLEHDADVNVYNENADTALSLASREGHYDVVELLLNYNSNASVREIGAQIPLVEASREGRNEVVKLLLRHGADTSITNSDGETAMKVAEQGGHDTVVDILVKHQSDTSTLLLDPETDLLFQQPSDVDRAVKEETDVAGRDRDHEASSEVNKRSKRRSKKKKDKKKGQTKEHKETGRRSKRFVKVREIFSPNLCKAS